MSKAKGYDRSVTDADLPAMGRLIALAFATPVELTGLWLRNAGLGECRVVRGGAGEAEACLLRIPQGHFYGGRSVPALGIAGVAVAPEARGRGLGREMMRASMLEAAEEGWALSSLYASTQSLYRQVGFEQSGHRFGIRIKAADIALGSTALAGEAPDAWKAIEARELTEADRDAVKACYREFASRYDGPLDRGAYCWGRVWNLRNEPYTGFGFFGEHGALEGYVYLNQKRNPDTGRHDVFTTDVVFTTARAGRALARFVRGFATTADDFVMTGGPLHPLLALLDQQCAKVTGKEYWMIRVVDARRSLEDRGWAAGVRADAAIEVTDDLLPRNSGVWRLSVADGRAAVEHSPGVRKGEDTLRVGARGLAALYSGMFSARQAAMAGLADGNDRAIEAAERVFTGGAPWMIEMF